jgi:serine/threonine protein kinase
MSPEFVARVHSIFADVAEAPPAERRARLFRVCGDDHALRIEVESLLAAHDAAGGFLDVPTDGAPSTDDDPADDVGTVVGAYRIGPLIGRGGFAAVHRATRIDADEPRAVAIKILCRGAILPRFARERAALERMHHPGIARLLDVGSMRDGRPFLVLELVDGEPITRFCAVRELDVATRVRLIEAVCLSVHHAHLQDVLHLDLKPTNVLVVSGAGEPRPVVVDFGIATLLDPRGEHDGDKMGTPHYMSPEQLAGGPIDARADVFGIGVLLYELLVGRTPCAVLGATGTGFLPRATPPSMFAPQAVAAIVRGGLDRIVVQALAAERTDRHATARAFAEALQGWRTGDGS